MKKLVEFICATFVVHAASEPASAYSFWDALAIIESGGDDSAVGSAGEVSRYQILPQVWRQYSERKDYSDQALSRQIAETHLNWLKQQYRKERGQDPSEADLCVMWNTGFEGYRRYGFKTANFTGTLRDRVERFTNLRSLNHRRAALPNAKVRANKSSVTAGRPSVQNHAADKLGTGPDRLQPVSANATAARREGQKIEIQDFFAKQRKILALLDR